MLGYDSCSKSLFFLPLTITEGEDFPLGVYRSRPDSVTLTIGYDAELLRPAKRTGQYSWLEKCLDVLVLTSSFNRIRAYAHKS